MTNEQKRDLAERVLRYASLGWSEKEAIQRCVNAGYKQATARKYYKIFVEREDEKH